MCSMGLRSGLVAGHGRTLDIPVSQEITQRTSSIAGGIVMLEGHVRMSLQEGYHMREDVFCVTHSVEIELVVIAGSLMILTHRPRP